MIQRAAFLFLLPVVAFASILPDTIGPLQRGEVTAAPAPDAKIWGEYGLQESETAAYADPAAGKKISITAYRFGDSTGAYAAWFCARPADAKRFETDGIGAETATDRYVAVGNLFLILHGYKPNKEELAHIFLTAPRYSHSPLPTLPNFMPSGALANSERYIVGPESLARYAPAIPPSTAAFRYSSEAELAQYGKTTLVVFNFPGIEMAQKQRPLFEAIPRAVVKRSGPLVAVALDPPDANEAERLLAQVKYQADVTISEPPPTLKNNPANLFLNIAILCGVLVALCLVSGLVFGGIRHIWRRGGSADEAEEMISLRISGRS